MVKSYREYPKERPEDLVSGTSDPYFPFLPFEARLKVREREGRKRLGVQKRGAITICQSRIEIEMKILKMRGGKFPESEEVENNEN